ncbi:retrotransposon protein, putative, ty1-copia subclass [Tanacetum coccineum]
MSFKKKIDIDGNVHTYKAHLVAKGFTHLYKVDYEETFSPVADIRAIRILIAIAASKRLFGLSQSAYIDKILKRYRMDNSKCGYIPIQETLELNKTQSASTPGEVKCMQNVPYASVVGSIMYAVFILNRGTVDWKSSKQSTIAMSATESEYIAASEAAMEAVWIRKFISGLGIVPTTNKPIKMFCDNSAALHFANEPGV